MARMRRRPRYSSPLDRHHHREQWCTQPANSPVDEPDDGPVEFFWQLVEASSDDDLEFLWPNFPERAAQLAGVEDVEPVLWHLGRAINASPFWSRPEHQGRRDAILAALAAAMRG
jgi:hypothetical protein